MAILPLGDDSDRSWEWYGQNDPYYGVLSTDEFRKEHLSRERLSQFFATGEAHVERILNVAQKHMGHVEFSRCLDFGCGVGRLVIPFSARFQQVVGVDISDAMLREARKNCEERGISNAAFCSRILDASGTYDFVHSYIVIQHIPVERGREIMDGLIDLLRPSGVAFLHFSIGRNAGWLRDLATFLRKNVRPVHWALNLFQGKRLSDAYMQVNAYPIGAILGHFHDRGIREMWMEVENQGGPYSVSVIFRKPGV